MDVAVPVFIVNPNNFDWITFFLGGAAGSFIGALIILGLDRFIDFLLTHNQSLLEKQKISQALLNELSQNIIICDDVIATISRDRTSIRAIGEFKFVWLETYSEKYIDFSNETSLALYTSIRNSKSYMRQISKIEDNIFMLSAAGAALGNYSQQVQRRNDVLIDLARILKKSFEDIKNSPSLIDTK